MPNANLFAQVVLLIWIPLGIFLMNRWSALRAAAFLMIGGVMYLPNLIAFDLPVLPPLTKVAIAPLAVWFGCLIFQPSSLKSKDVTGKTGLLFFATFAAALLTAATNGDPLQIGPIVKKPMSLYDGFVIALGNVISTALPFYLGHRLIRTTADLRYIQRALVIGALLYVPYILVEGRVAPFLHRSVYGYFQHDWTQAKREGGFRAFVFMSHALTVAFYTAQSTMMVGGLSRLKEKILPFSTKILTPVLLVALIACKSMAALTYALVGLPILWFTSPRMILRISRWLALIALTYPLTRLFELFPLEWLVDKAVEIDPLRAESLAFRFENEVTLLEKASQRFLFGWGGWGRNRNFDLNTGADLSTVDGQWIIELGAGGLAGFYLIFGPVLVPIFLALRAGRHLPVKSDDLITLAVAAFYLAFVGIDMLPNSMGHPLPFFIGGGLASVSGRILASRRGPAASRSPQVGVA